MSPHTIFFLTLNANLEPISQSDKKNYNKKTKNKKKRSGEKVIRLGAMHQKTKQGKTLRKERVSRKSIAPIFLFENV